jgi:4-hydroxyphenylpyruvate dioxygenase
MRSLLYLESEARQRWDAPAQPQRVELFDPPPAPALSSLSFIEFAADEASAEKLGTLLRQLGFRRAGQHRSKAVTLYRQGEINLIVNAQPDSFARSRFEAHGTSVCALGVRCADPLAAVDRATAMRSQRHDSPVGPNEQHVPAVVAPGGNLIHFVPEALGVNGLYEADFILEEDTPPDANDAGLQQIDHVALGLALDQLDTWVLFTRAVLGLEPGESLELADPFGLIRSRGVANADRSVRLVLNVSLSQRTRTARTLRKSGGGAVHHIALRCDDIFESVAQLRANGVAFVPISGYYHDDLATRIDLDGGLIERMRAAGVLFDRSPAGDYLHIYTESFENGLFFEVVQRVDGYDAYGATNAPARMASQAQS